MAQRIPVTWESAVAGNRELRKPGCRAIGCVLNRHPGKSVLWETSGPGIQCPTNQGLVETGVPGNQGPVNSVTQETRNSGKLGSLETGGMRNQGAEKPVVRKSGAEQMSTNSSSISQFLLLPFADTRELQLLHFCLFLGIYLAALLGNGLIIITIACDQHLHTPMYFFLLKLSVTDIGCISTTVPKSMANSLWDTRAISYTGCVAKLFFFVLLIVTDACLLTVMAYDRYVAICHPLHYGTLLGSRACVHMAAAAWASGFLHAVLHTANIFSLPLCHGNAVDQFFCEIPQILKLSCSDAYLREIGVIVVNACLDFGCFVFIVVSYVQIFRAVLSIPSEPGLHKAFSTCLPHLAVLSLFLSTGLIAYLKPPSISSQFLDLVVSFLYSVVPPAVNLLIYSMRNLELKDAVWKLMIGYI
ncbi:olfactory receptor 14A16-like [Porphyrio hochstetteri]